MNEKMNMSQAINIALAILLVIALGVTVYSINQVRSLQSEAKGKPTDQGVNLRKLAKTANMTVSPDSVTVGEKYTINGTGHEADVLVTFSEATPGCCSSNLAGTDANGEFTTARTANTAGEYRISSFQIASNGKLIKMAEVSFTVK